MLALCVRYTHVCSPAALGVSSVEKTIYVYFRVCARAGRDTRARRGSADSRWTIRSDPGRPQRANKTAPSLHTLLLNLFTYQ
jgi:hypothetical protein